MADRQGAPPAHQNVPFLHAELLEAIPGGFVHVLADGSIVDANAEALRLLGLSFDELTSRYTRDFETETIWEDGSPCAVADYPVTRAFVTGEPQPATTIGVRRSDGEVLWAVFRAVPLRSEPGAAVTSVVATFVDITARRQVEEDLRRHRELLRRAQEIAHVGSWEWDVGTGAVRWTDELHRICGLPLGAFDGRIESALDPVHPDDRDLVTRHTARIFREGGAREIEYRVVRPDGSIRVVFGGGKALRDASGQVVKIVGAIQDVTERHELEEQLRHSQRMDSIGQLAGGVAHDFNNLLQVILGNLERVLQGPDRPPALLEVRHAAERGSELTRQLLSFGRREPVTLVDLDLNRLVQRHAGLVERLLGERLVMELELGDGVGTVSGDRTQLDQVLMNLCINARDAMPEGGRVQLGTRAVAVDDEFAASRPWATARSYAELSVRDEGSGMTSEVRERVFEPFFTTKSVGEGTGLGLAVVYGIVQQHGGMVEVESEPGAGTTFRVYLPSVDRAPAPETEAEPRIAPGGRETILVVEDEPLVRELAVDILEDAGYRVLTAGTGPQALELFEHAAGEVALVVSDMVMPQMDGGELAARLRQRSADVRILFTTGYATPGAIGGTPVLSKPYSVVHLLEKVREVLDGR